MTLLYAPQPLPAAALRISLDFTQLILFNFENFSLVGSTPRFTPDQVTPGVAGHLTQPMPRARYQLARKVLPLPTATFTPTAGLYAGSNQVDGDGIAAVWEATARSKRTRRELSLRYCCMALPAHATYLALGNNLQLSRIWKVGFTLHHEAPITPQAG